MANVGLQVLSDGYRIRVGEEASEVVSFGEPAEFECGGKLYIAYASLPGESSTEIEGLEAGWVFEASDTGAEIEEADEEEDEDGEESEEVEEDEEETVG